MRKFAVIAAFLNMKLRLPVLYAAIALTLPGGKIQNLSLTQRQVGQIEVFYEKGVLDGEEGLLWLSRANQVLKRAYQFYAKAKETKELSHCSTNPHAMPVTKFVFLDAIPTPRRHLDEGRTGYYHHDNPGPLIETHFSQGRFENNSSLEGILAHEAVHFWCKASPSRTTLENWKEEGAADYLRYRTTGSIPQAQITRYFKNPCVDSLYGASFLWWAALFETRQNKEQFLQTLAEMHLGLREDLFLGSLSDKPCSKKNIYPSGRITHKPNPTGIPFWETAWKSIELAPHHSHGANPMGYWIWTGPVPH